MTLAAPPAAAPPAARKPLYRRPFVWLAGLVAVFIVAAIIVDIPVAVTHSDRQAQSASYVRSLKSDASECVAGLREAFTIEGLVVSGKTTSSERSEVPGLLNDDLGACSLTNNSIYDMEANLSAPTFSGGASLAKVNTAMYYWQVRGAYKTIEALQRLLGPPVDLGARSRVLRAEHVLATERRQAETTWARAARAIGVTLPKLDLPQPELSELGTRTPS